MSTKINTKHKNINNQKLQLRTYLHKNTNIQSSNFTIPPKKNRQWFTCTEISNIYNFPKVNSQTQMVIGVVSFGGGLFGTLTNSVLTGGDVQNYWSLLGISETNMPTVVINLVDGALNNPSDINSTSENTLDVATIGACYAGSNLTIILYIAPNTSSFYNIFDNAINNFIFVGNKSYKPTIISVSWGAPEVAIGTTLLNKLNVLYAKAVLQGINICAATGDFGSSDGITGLTDHTKTLKII
jgi:kumamolisin